MDIAKLLPEFFLPLGLTLQLFLYGWLLRNRAPLLATGLRGAAVTILVVFSMPIVSDSLIRSLEARHPAPDIAELPKVDVIVLLGGGIQSPATADERAELGAGADRLLQTYELWLAGKSKRIIVSSGEPGLSPEFLSEATITKNIFTRWGIPDNAVIIESNSTNTEQNAAQTISILNKNQWHNLLLVTSATHMPRSVALFNRPNLQVIPVAADHWVNDKQTYRIADFIPHGVSLGGSTRALREYLGLLFYASTGRITWGDLKIGLALSTGA